MTAQAPRTCGRPYRLLRTARMRPRKTFNPKRRIRAAPESETDRRKLDELSLNARYGGNPEHKRNPGDFGLKPPSLPRAGKTLCDAAGIFRRIDAIALLKTGLERGFVSEQFRGGWPQNVWAVTREGIAVEAQLENPVTGNYHGYPLPASDPLRADVLRRWYHS